MHFPPVAQTEEKMTLVSPWQSPPLSLITFLQPVFTYIWASQTYKLHRQISAVPSGPELSCLNLGSKRE